MQETVLVSRCMLPDDLAAEMGANNRCRYNGTSRPQPEISKLAARGVVIIPFCPEEDAGMATPRDPAERQKDGRVVTNKGEDVTASFMAGAKMALTICQENNVKKAILMKNSPSCGKRTYNGEFNGTIANYGGITAELLMENDIDVTSSDELT